MMRLWIVFAALNGLCAVALGAWASHGMESLPAAAELMKTGVQYQMWHALALIGVAWLSDDPGVPKGIIGTAGFCFLIGILLVRPQGLLGEHRNGDAGRGAVFDVGTRRRDPTDGRLGGLRDCRADPTLRSTRRRTAGRTGVLPDARRARPGRPIRDACRYRPPCPPP